MFLWFQLCFCQNIEISGKILGSDDVENIHVINKSQKKYAVSNVRGEFNIKAFFNDTLVFSSVQYKIESIIVSEEDILTKKIAVTLESNVNELKEVVVGKVLTGDLLSDLKNSDAKPTINFYDVGIPGYVGKPKTQNERLLYEAGEFKPKMLLGLLMGSVPINPILNGISGRTKMLKQRVKLEKEEQLLFSLKSRLELGFFKENPLDESSRLDFFYFCSDDPNFVERCRDSDLEALVFFKEKYEHYLKNRKGKD